ncbi:MAG: RdgB/HAM1 family non-canonical purine NTP pyrophosphatase [Xanthomonadales bacterium]|nr:RdgB/HAM1 family non-canonical purine NTP pyrophosphatase [Xanthomonadales bacterium]
MQQLVLATGNPGKLLEMRELLAPLGFQVLAQSELGVTEVDEPGPGFIENALIKARHAARITGLPAIADDSGLVVPALAGAPGVYSARYAGEDANAEKNNQKLLQAMSDLHGDQRQAYFICQIAAVSAVADPLPLLALGRWQGVILSELQGKKGFGYDPLFAPQGMNCSAAELTPADKNQFSHRGLAMVQLIKQIRSFW